ncbi:MAG TPA: metal-dependent transcriptional regulator [Hadesarchaea archaeon]|nr:metal-dependent transcriptional regulator [Hadesarchaea archaeon]
MIKKKFSSSVEDYLEAIYFIGKERGSVRTSDIAFFLKHKPPSVTEMLDKLSKKGFIKHEKYGTVSLTLQGMRIAEEVSGRHNTLISFLELLGVDRGTAEIDACKMEHILNRRTINRLRRFVEFVQRAPKEPEWLEHYKHFVKTGEHLECKSEGTK